MFVYIPTFHLNKLLSRVHFTHFLLQLSHALYTTLSLHTSLSLLTSLALFLLDTLHMIIAHTCTCSYMYVT